MPRCPVCDTVYPEEDRFCALDGTALSKPSSAKNLIGTMIGTYRLTKKIGEGGMGVVYEAIHPVIERKIAIKIIHPSKAQQKEVVCRFFDEAKALARSKHPNIVEIYDLGELEEGVVFLEMELLQGRSLRVRILEKPLLADEIRYIFSRVAAGLCAAHQAGVIHRDLKPENIFLCEDRQVKILDFGVVKLLDKEHETAGWTKPGMLVGTPEYMSPEQVLGEGKIDQRSDIYSFGLLLYEALAGGLPFETTSLIDILTTQVQTIFPKPSEIVGKPFDPILEAVIQKCLKKKPEARYNTMSEVLAALQEFQNPYNTAVFNPPKTPPSFDSSSQSLTAQKHPDEITPGDLRKGTPLKKTLRIRERQWHRIDAFNIGDQPAEKAHILSTENPPKRIQTTGLFPNGRTLTSNGMLYTEVLSFCFSGLIPGKDAFLLLRIDVDNTQESEIDTQIDGVSLKTRPIVKDSQYRWRHETVFVPGNHIQQDQIIISRRPKGPLGSNLYAAWIYQAL